MLGVIIDPATYVWLLAGLATKSQWFRFELPKLRLLFDELYCFGPKEMDLLNTEPYGTISEIGGEVIEGMSEHQFPSKDELKDFMQAIGDKPDAEGGEIAYLMFMSMLDIAKKKKAYYYMFPGQREDFINFCLRNRLDCLQVIKESCLICNILEYVFEQHIPAFDPIKSMEQIHNFKDYKKDFQDGILYYFKQFEGSYTLSDDQKKYVRDKIANEEKRLLDFLKPENLRRFNISVLDIASEIVGGIIPYPLPIGVVLNLLREVKELRDFKKANLNFAISLFILKKIVNVGEVGEVPRCSVCNLSMPEIENMTEEECNETLYNSEMCIEHMVGRLDLRKRFRLHGKELLRQLKRLGDSSVLIDT